MNIFYPVRLGILVPLSLALVSFTFLGAGILAESAVFDQDAKLEIGTAPTIDSPVQGKRAAVLSAAEVPAANTSQGLYIKILREAGFEASAVSAAEVREKKLDGFDIFIIGGGSGTAFNKSLGADGGKVVQEFIRKGGGALASCAGGYSFINGNNEVRQYVTIAQAKTLDSDDGHWARGKAVVEIAPVDERYRTLRMFYQNGPLWEIAEKQVADRTVALALFKSDVKKEGDPGGAMPGTPAILGGTYGDGRFIFFSGHPEFYEKLGNHSFVSDAANWVTRGPLAENEAIRWHDVFPSSPKLEPTPSKTLEVIKAVRPE